VDRRWVYAGLAAALGVGLVRAIRAPKVHAGTRLLLIGDSLAVGLAPQLKALAAEQKVPFLGTATVSTRIDQWAQSAALQQTLSAFRPTLVLVSLGTNDEYLTGNAVQRQSPYLDQLLQRLAPAEVVWIGPPTLPKPSNGIVAFLQSKIPASQYFPSQTLQIPRAPDRIHPTAKGYAAWAGALWQWLL
jgi:lysophospholipase L1-like esterase